jgi:hypothetical protein
VARRNGKRAGLAVTENVLASRVSKAVAEWEYTASISPVIAGHLGRRRTTQDRVEVLYGPVQHRWTPSSTTSPRTADEVRHVASGADGSEQRQNLRATLGGRHQSGRQRLLGAPTRSATTNQGQFVLRSLGHRKRPSGEKTPGITISKASMLSRCCASPPGTI